MDCTAVYYALFIVVLFLHSELMLEEIQSRITMKDTTVVLKLTFLKNTGNYLFGAWLSLALALTKYLSIFCIFC